MPQSLPPYPEGYSRVPGHAAIYNGDTVWAEYVPRPMEGWVFIPETPIPTRVKVEDEAEPAWVIVTEDGVMHYDETKIIVDTTMEG